MHRVCNIHVIFKTGNPVKANVLFWCTKYGSCLKAFWNADSKRRKFLYWVFHAFKELYCDPVLKALWIFIASCKSSIYMWFCSEISVLHKTNTFGMPCLFCRGKSAFYHRVDVKTSKSSPESSGHFSLNCNTLRIFEAYWI